MNYEIKRFSVWSVAKISFVLGAVFGFVFGMFAWLFAGLISQVNLDEFGTGMEGMEGLAAMGILLPFFMAVFYGLASMVANAFITGVYNIIASMVGGVEMSLEARAPAAGAYPQQAVTTAPAPPPPVAPPPPPQQPPPTPPTPPPSAG